MYVDFRPVEIYIYLYKISCLFLPRFRLKSKKHCSPRSTLAQDHPGGLTPEHSSNNFQLSLTLKKRIPVYSTVTHSKAHNIHNGAQQQGHCVQYVICGHVQQQ